MLPALLSQGLMDYKPHYQKIEAVYYDMDTTILFLAFMYLCRIHNIEQLQQISSGESEKLGDILSDQIIPRLMQQVSLEVSHQALLAEREIEMVGMKYVKSEKKRTTWI